MSRSWRWARVWVGAALVGLVCRSEKPLVVRVRTASGALQRVTMTAGGGRVVGDVRACCAGGCGPLFRDAACTEAAEDGATLESLGVSGRGEVLYAKKKADTDPKTSTTTEAAASFRPYPALDRRVRQTPLKGAPFKAFDDAVDVKAASDGAKRVPQIDLDAATLAFHGDGGLYGTVGDTGEVTCEAAAPRKAHDKADHLAKKIGLKPVGCVFAHEGCERQTLVAREVMEAARLQVRAMEKAGRASCDAGPFPFVVLSVGRDPETGATSVEAFEISEHAVHLGAGKFFADPDPDPQDDATVNTTAPVKLGGLITKRIEPAWLYRPIPILQRASRLSHAFAPGSSVGDVLATSGVTLETLADFAFLLALKKKLNARDFDAVCAAVRAYVAGPKEATLPKTLAVLLEAKFTRR